MRRQREMQTRSAIKLNNQSQEVMIPQQFFCPITLQIMNDPVILQDGISYERKAIQPWLISNNTSPATGVYLSNKTLTPNLTLRNSIISFKRNFLPLIQKNKHQKMNLQKIIKERESLLQQKKQEMKKINHESYNTHYRSQMLQNQLNYQRSTKNVKEQTLVMKNVSLARQLFKQRQMKNEKVKQLKELKILANHPLRYQQHLSNFYQKSQRFKAKQAQLMKIIQKINNTAVQNQQKGIFGWIVDLFSMNCKQQSEKMTKMEYLDWQYKGLVNRNKEPEGYGRVSYYEQSQYYGNFIKGQRTGFGKQQWKSGDIYIGQFTNGKADGFGQYKWRQQNILEKAYHGDFIQDQFFGFGKMYYKNGQEQRYQGQWKDSKWHGYGLIFYKNQSFFNGYFHEGKKHGQGKSINPDGEQFFQKWDKGVLLKSQLLKKAE